VLRPGGLLGLVSLTCGASLSARALTAAWRRLWAVRPWLLGGCRPIEITGLLAPAQWSLRDESSVGKYVLTSQVVVAERV
jgi:hypothetical protein